MNPTVSARLITNLLLFLSLIFTSITKGQSVWYDIGKSVSTIMIHAQAGFDCITGGGLYAPFSTSNGACNLIFPYNIATCTDNSGASVDNDGCTDSALLNYVNELATAESTKAQCIAATNTFINTNNACKPVIAAATPQPYLDELQAMVQPFIDISCIVTQLQAADSNNIHIFLPGCDPKNTACAALNFNDQFGNPYYYMAPNLIWSYLAGYVYNYPNSASQPTQPKGFGIRDYVKNWTLAQTYAQSGQDQMGNQIAAQINVFNPNSFLNATNNITSQIIGDLQLALQKNIDLLAANPANDFPGSNLGLLNNKTITCNPNVNYQVPCCNTPTMSWPDAQANLMNSLNQKMNAILIRQQDQTALEYFQTYTLFNPLDPTKIPELAQIDPVGSMLLSSSTSTIINNLPQPLYVGKVVTNYPNQQAVEAATQEYFTQAALTDQIFLTAVDVNGNTVSCAPGNLVAQYQNVMQTCALAAEEIAPFDAAVAFLATLVIYAVAFELAGAGAELLVEDVELDTLITSLMNVSGRGIQALLKLYGVALNIGMFINFSSGGKTWFESLPVGVQEVWSPPLNIITPTNLKILEKQLLCSLNEALLEYSPTSSSAIANQTQACRYDV
ncbi:MAG TPA: hypothetical protein VJJ81_00325 [Candidatus Babeliales bacterium]|nr:hypothetical protein [Candidatus Babeliales bacterium]